MNPAKDTDAPVRSSDVGVYVHFPYCEKKCPYCDFNSHVAPHDDAAYADAILRELEARGHDIVRGREVRSLYFGGGTPSLWDPKQVSRVVDGVRTSFGAHPDWEVTLEANPGTVHESLFEAFVRAGIGRFSIGAQSFVDGELVQLGRIHDARASTRAVRAAKSTGARVSLDLIYAQPRQTKEALDRSIAAALELEPDHISAYTLTVEPNTVLGRQYEAGRFVPMEDDLQAEQIAYVTQRLEDAGYLRYEVSSYAPVGHEAIHNSLYWVGGEYLGVGAGAHSYRADAPLRSGLRRANRKSPQLYLDGTHADHPAGMEEQLGVKEVLLDRLLTGVRVRWGIDIAALDDEGAVGGQLVERLEPCIDALTREGLVDRREAHIAPTAQGMAFVDLIARRLFDALEAWSPSV